MLKKPIVLLILDGWGLRTENKYNAIAAANPQNFTYLWEHYPHTKLQSSGAAVGLPDSFMGNSEVGHLTIGAGRIIPHMLVQISKYLEHNTLPNPEMLSPAFLAEQRAIHLIGLVSDGGVHSHYRHLEKLISYIRSKTDTPIYIHAILDGRDTPPTSALTYLETVTSWCHNYNDTHLASISGRWYAMDRDENWERTAQYTEMLSDNNSPYITDYHKYLEAQYQKNSTDEYIPPTKTIRIQIKPGDLVVFWNYRADRMRQLVSWLSNIALPSKKQAMPEHPSTGPYNIITMTQYHDALPFPALFERIIVENTLLERLHTQGLRTCAIAETEKYAHVTYFFNGGRDYSSPLEQRILIPSIITERFDQCPAMSAQAITTALLHGLKNNQADVYIVNLANADMVGHTGNFEATIEAVKTVDMQIGKIYQAVREQQGTLIVTADHGNAELMWNETTNTPHTAHTTNPVPLIVTNRELQLQNLHGLADIASLFFTKK